MDFLHDAFKWVTFTYWQNVDMAFIFKMIAFICENDDLFLARRDITSLLHFSYWKSYLRYNPFNKASSLLFWDKGSQKQNGMFICIL